MRAQRDTTAGHGELLAPSGVFISIAEDQRVEVGGQRRHAVGSAADADGLGQYVGTPLVVAGDEHASRVTMSPDNRERRLALH